MKKLIMVLMCILLLVGCADNYSKPLISDQQIKPNMMSLSGSDNRYYYVVDKNTHVVYLAFYVGNHGGITVCVKADGSPMLAEDLGIKVGDTDESN